MPDTHPDDTDADLAPNEVEIRDILDEEQANLDNAATHGAHGRGVQVLWTALKRIAKKLSEDSAYRATTDDLDELDARLSEAVRNLGGAGEGAMQAGPHGVATLDENQRATMMALVQAWWTWAPSMMATGDPNLAQFVQTFGPLMEAHFRAHLPAYGFPAASVNEYIAGAHPFVPPVPNGSAGTAA